MSRDSVIESIQIAPEERQFEKACCKSTLIVKKKQKKKFFFFVK